jgi:hypothetical protein
MGNHFAGQPVCHIEGHGVGVDEADFARLTGINEVGEETPCEDCAAGTDEDITFHGGTPPE